MVPSVLEVLLTVLSVFTTALVSFESEFKMALISSWDLSWILFSASVLFFCTYLFEVEVIDFPLGSIPLTDENVSFCFLVEVEFWTATTVLFLLEFEFKSGDFE